METFGKKNYITNSKVAELRNISKARVGMSEFADNFSKDKRFMRTNWLWWEVVFLGDRSSSSRGGCLSHWSQSLSLSVILTFWHLSEIFLTSFWHLSVIFLTYFCHLSDILISIFYRHHSVLLPFCLFVFVSFRVSLFLSFCHLFRSVLAHLHKFIRGRLESIWGKFDFKHFGSP